LIAATVAWEILFCDVRKISAALMDDWHIYDMARLAYALDVFYRWITDDDADVSTLLDADYHVLSTRRFPELIEFRESRRGERSDASSGEGRDGKAQRGKDS
jgi:hypothetical protein